MKPCPENRPITLAYGVEGPAWASGEHGGVDWGCPKGDPVYAPWYGTVVGVRNSVNAYGTTWGSSYGTHIVLAFDDLPSGDSGLWGVLAHLSRANSVVGQRLAPGQQVGWSGSTGKSSGPHLHFEVQTQMRWRVGGHIDPQAWIDAVEPVVYLSKLRYGVEGSPSVRELQFTLNKHDLAGGVVLPQTGNYYGMTDTEVRRDQAAHGNTWGQSAADPVGASDVGPRQAAHLFAGRHVKVVDDRANPVTVE